MPLRPVVVRHHVIDGDAILTSQPGDEPRCTGDCGRLLSGVAEFTNLDPDAALIAGAVVIGVLALNVEREVLNRRSVVDGEMPGEVAGSVPATASAESAGGHPTRMLQRRGPTIRGAMDGDVMRAQRKFDPPSESLCGHRYLLKIDGCGTSPWR